MSADRNQEAARRLAEWEEAREVVRCVGASVSDLRVETVLAYGLARERAGLENAAKRLDELSAACLALDADSMTARTIWAIKAEVNKDGASAIRALMEEK